MFKKISNLRPKRKLVQKSQTEVTKKDQLQIEQDSKQELNWHKQTPRYQTNQDIQVAFQKRELVKIGETKDYRPITRLLNPDTDLQYPPYLRPEAKKVLDELASIWRSKVRSKYKNGYSNVLLPLTFLVCSEDYKKELLKTPGKILNSEGTHATGYTFDIDASSYYIKEGDNFFSVADPRRNPDIIQQNTENLIKIGGSKMHTLRTSKPYNKQLTDLLVETAQELHASGKANVILEYAGSQNQCLHICVKP
ncbi:MAG: hypothetical protein H6799_00955 [Candidatus Nomurabacteria bacterium]|nr:MAG: hypothetical protein H6799_00955 [Candidatus Nomurabacteria bacterium]HRV76399.1 DUF5715 family protein [Candidatus Saccharimonadales bacterium]